MAKQDPALEASAELLDKPITTSQLLELLAKMNSESSKTLAEAIVQAQKPYTDPLKEENDRLFREQSRRQAETERANTKANQASCPHIAGCNQLSESADMYGRTCIVWHQSDSTEVFGICTNCQRIFRDTDPDYMEWRRKQSINRISKSGYREFSDPLAARERARN